MTVQQKDWIKTALAIFTAASIVLAAWINTQTEIASIRTEMLYLQKDIFQLSINQDADRAKSDVKLDDIQKSLHRIELNLKDKADK